MPEIDTTDADERQQFACPTPLRHRNWRVVDGHFQCRSCDEIFESLVDLKSGDTIHRSEFEFVGPGAKKQTRKPVELQGQ